MTMPAHLPRDLVVATARTWIGTPYHHQASCRGVGTDCLGLIRGVWRELFGYEAEAPPSYSRDWAEANGIEAMLDAAERHLEFTSRETIGAGDVVVFRMHANAVAKHAAIITGPSTMVHAVEGAPVSEVAVCGWWRRRIAAAYRFPGII